MTGPRAVLLDLDGTLVDTVLLHAHAWQDAFRTLGKDLPLETIRRQIGKGGDELLPALLTPEEQARIGDEADRRHGERFEQVYRQTARPLPGARELIERLRADGRSVALASSGKPDDVAYFRRLLGLDDELLDAGATTSHDAERSKPAPDIFQAALGRARVPAAQAVAVGDSPWDAISAGRAGVRTVGLLSGGFEERALREAGCVAVYRDTADLLAQYDASPLAR